MKVAIIGSRTITDFDFVEQKICSGIEVTSITQIISGGAKGIDSLAIVFAKKYNIPYLELLPDWKIYGRGAGLIRNKQIAEQADMLIAFVEGESKGTLHTLSQALKLHKKVIRIEYGEPPV